MAFNEEFPKDDSYIADFPAGEREQNRAIRQDQIVDAGKLQGLVTGNGNGNIPINNGNENINLNAGKLNGKTSADFATKVHTHDTATQSSNGYMSNADKKKLDGIASGAEINQNTFANIKVGSTTIQADAKQDTLELTAGANISLVGDANNDKVTIGVTGIDTTYIKGVTGSNATLTVTKGNGTTSTVTVNNVEKANIVTEKTITGNTLASALPVGMTWSRVYRNDFPCEFGNCLSIRGQGAGQFLIEWLGTDATPANIYYRSARDASIDKWSAWRTLAHTGGTIANATKATQDKNGFQIDTGYLKRNQTTQNDMNACTVEGIYRFNGDLTGAWTGTSWGTLLVFNNKYNGGSGTTGTYLVQMALPTDGRIWTRQRVNAGGWNSWVKIANTNDCTDILKKAYPVGSIYMSTVSTNPATLFGFGTWEAMPAGRVLLAQGTASWGTYNAGSTGGEATHKLTVGEMPTHSHSGSTNWAGEHNHAYTWRNYQGWAGSKSDTRIWEDTATNWTGDAGNHVHTISIDNTGSGQAHNNMPPYLAIYIWKRVS